MKKLYLKILSQSSIYALGNLSQSALAIALLPIYTRYLTPADYGILALMDLTILLITRLVIPPVDSALGRYYYKPEYVDRQGLLLFNLLVFLLIAAGCLVCLYWSLSGFIVYMLFDGNQELLYVVQTYVAILGLECLTSFLLVYIRMREIAKYFVFLSLSRLLLSTGLILYLLMALDLGILAVIYGQIFGACYLTAMALPLLLKESTFQISPAIVKEPLKFGYPLLVSGYANLLLESGDRYMLNMLASVSSVGLYSLGYKISSLLNTVLIVPLNQAIAPIVYQKEESPDDQKRLLVTMATYYYFVGTFMALGLSLLAKEIIMLLAAPQFWSAWMVVPIIAFSYLQHGLGQFFKWGALLRNKPYHVSAMVLLSAILNVALNFVLIPRWGILGAALATLAAYVFWSILKLYYSAKFYNLHFDLGQLGHITIVGVILYLISLVFASTNSLIFNVFIKLMILSTYPLLFYISDSFVPDERNYMRRIKLILR
jgi:O-antigen/teichoic acid export membrane protein